MKLFVQYVFLAPKIILTNTARICNKKQREERSLVQVLAFQNKKERAAFPAKSFGRGCSE